MYENKAVAEILPHLTKVTKASFKLSEALSIHGTSIKERDKQPKLNVIKTERLEDGASRHEEKSQ